MYRPPFAVGSSPGPSTPRFSAALPLSAFATTARYPYPSDPFVRYPAHGVPPTGADQLGYLRMPDLTFDGSATDVPRLEHQRKRPSMMSNFPATVSSAIDAVSDGGSIHKRPRMLDSFPSFPGHGQPLPMPDRDRGMQRMLSYPTPLIVSGDSLPSRSTYHPQVENISPTPEDQLTSERDRILDVISKLDRDIAVTENDLKRSRKKEAELVESAKHGEHESIIEEDKVVDGQTLFEKIYAENRRKAQKSHALFAHILPPCAAAPIYNQPCDISSLKEIREKFDTSFKAKLMAHLAKKRQAQLARERTFTSNYNQLKEVWLAKVEKMENNPKRKARDAKALEIFEKTFPELKKSTIEKERSGRLETRSGILGSKQDLTADCGAENSDAESDQKRIQQSAVCVPLFIDERSRCRYFFVNNTGLVRDAAVDHEQRLTMFHCVWTDDEKRIFRERFIQYPKNFAAIASFLEPRKTTKDCVQYYYLTKKAEKYKQLLRRRRKAPTKIYRPPQMPTAQEKSQAASKDDVADESANQPPPEPEFYCVICKAKIDVNNGGRPLTRACYEHYGLEQDVSQADLRICQKCYLSFVRKKHIHANISCAVGTCSTARRKVKSNRPFPPPKWSELTAEQQKKLTDDFQIGSDATKVCNGCHKRICRKVDAMIAGESMGDEGPAPVLPKPDVWTELEMDNLKQGILKFGFDNQWISVATVVGTRSAAECQRVYEHQRAKVIGGEQSTLQTSDINVAKQPVMGIESEDDEENNSSEQVTPADSPPKVSIIAKPKVVDEDVPGVEVDVDGPLLPDLDHKIQADNDSNATLSADETEEVVAMVASGLATTWNATLTSCTVSGNPVSLANQPTQPMFMGVAATDRAKIAGATGKFGGSFDPSQLPSLVTSSSTSAIVSSESVTTSITKPPTLLAATESTMPYFKPKHAWQADIAKTVNAQDAKPPITKSPFLVRTATPASMKEIIESTISNAMAGRDDATHAASTSAPCGVGVTKRLATPKIEFPLEHPKPRLAEIPSHVSMHPADPKPNQSKAPPHMSTVSSGGSHPPPLQVKIEPGMGLHGAVSSVDLQTRSQGQFSVITARPGGSISQGTSRSVVPQNVVVGLQPIEQRIGPVVVDQTSRSATPVSRLSVFPRELEFIQGKRPASTEFGRPRKQPEELTTPLAMSVEQLNNYANEKLVRDLQSGISEKDAFEQYTKILSTTGGLPASSASVPPVTSAANAQSQQLMVDFFTSQRLGPVSTSGAGTDQIQAFLHLQQQQHEQQQRIQMQMVQQALMDQQNRAVMQQKALIEAHRQQLLVEDFQRKLLLEQEQQRWLQSIDPRNTASPLSLAARMQQQQFAAAALVQQHRGGMSTSVSAGLKPELLQQQQQTSLSMRNSPVTSLPSSASKLGIPTHSHMLGGSLGRSTDSLNRPSSSGNVGGATPFLSKGAMKELPPDVPHYQQMLPPRRDSCAASIPSSSSLNRSLPLKPSTSKLELNRPSSVHLSHRQIAQPPSTSTPAIEPISPPQQLITGFNLIDSVINQQMRSVIGQSPVPPTGPMVISVGSAPNIRPANVGDLGCFSVQQRVQDIITQDYKLPIPSSTHLQAVSSGKSPLVSPHLSMSTRCTATIQPQPRFVGAPTISAVGSSPGNFSFPVQSLAPVVVTTTSATTSYPYDVEPVSPPEDNTGPDNDGTIKIDIPTQPSGSWPLQPQWLKYPGGVVAPGPPQQLLPSRSVSIEPGTAAAIFNLQRDLNAVQQSGFFGNRMTMATAAPRMGLISSSPQMIFNTSKIPQPTFESVSDDEDDVK